MFGKLLQLGALALWSRDLWSEGASGRAEVRKAVGAEAEISYFRLRTHTDSWAVGSSWLNGDSCVFSWLEHGVAQVTATVAVAARYCCLISPNGFHYDYWLNSLLN